MLNSLGRQLFAGISVAFLVLLVGIEAIHVASTRSYLQEQLESHAQDAATSLGLSLGTLLARGDPALAETIINPIFDRGYYEHIELVSIGGEVMISKSMPIAELGVPQWFAALLPLHAPTADSLVTSGWRQVGSVRVTSHPRFAYRELWRTAWGTLAWLIGLYLVALAAAQVFLKGVLRPLEHIERTAIAIGERDFAAVAVPPRTRELRHLAEAINSLSAKVRDAIESESAHAETLRQAAYQDGVTGLLNRKGFDTQFATRMREEDDVFRGALALVQFRNFAQFNQDVGYEQGDTALRLVAAAITAQAGKGALCARWSGAAFVVALANAAADDVATRIERLARAIEATLSDGHFAQSVAFSIGVAAFDGAVPELGQMLAAADGAAANAGERGSGLVDLVKIGAGDEALGSGAWREVLEGALARGGFKLYAQAVYALLDRSRMQLEIMTRLIGPDGLAVAAQGFFPMAVRHGQVARIDRNIIERVVAHLAAEGGEGDIAVNISARSVADAEFCDWLRKRLTAAPAVARRLIFELTESGAARDRDMTLGFATMLRQVGARFALDNFGLHPESLQLMRSLLPDYVKLSSAHTARLLDDEASRFFAASLVRLGSPLEIRVIAQNVEDETVLPVLAEIGIAGFQGYLTGAPTPWQT